MGQPVAFTAGSGHPPGRTGARHATIAPYGPFSPRTGPPILVGIQNEPERTRFCTVLLDRPGLADDGRFASNTLRVRHRDELDTLGGAVPATVPPYDLVGSEPVMGPMPDVGEHSDPVLAELGYTPDEVTALRAAGAL